MGKQNLVLHTLQYYNTLDWTVLYNSEAFCFCSVPALKQKHIKLLCLYVPLFYNFETLTITTFDKFDRFVLLVHHRSWYSEYSTRKTPENEKDDIFLVSTVFIRRNQYHIWFLLHLSHSLNEIKNLPKLNYIIVGQK